MSASKLSFSYLHHSQIKDVGELFTSVFTDSEGVAEGKLIGELAVNLCEVTKPSKPFLGDVMCLGATDDIGAQQANDKSSALVAVIFFTKLDYGAGTTVFMLAPVAVLTKRQNQGVGQALINFGLSELKAMNVDVVVTYGDPNYYSRCGFQCLSENRLKAPLPLSIPRGWLAQSLTGEDIPALSAKPSCVEAFNNPVYW